MHQRSNAFRKLHFLHFIAVIAGGDLADKAPFKGAQST